MASDYAMASRSATKSTKTWMINNLVFLMASASIAFFVLVISFEKNMQISKVNAADELRQGQLLLDRNSPKRGTAKHKKTLVMNWKPLEAKCKDDGFWLDPFPETFDPARYRSKYGNGADHHHYVEVGRKLGYECTRGQHLRRLLDTEILPKFQEFTEKSGRAHMFLEIGPFVNPMLLGEGVKYFEVMDLPKLKERAEHIGYPLKNPVNIDYVHPTGDLLDAIHHRQAFSLIASSNVLPHQLDLVGHLQAVGELLIEGGYYAMVLADKRYMIDHFLPETSIADVLDDHYGNRRGASSHKMRSVIEHRALTVHSDAQLHWAKQHGAKFRSPDDFVDRVKTSMKEYNQAKEQNSYVDVHNYHFTPQSLAFIVDTLFNLELTNVRVHRLYDPLTGEFEFGIVLKKCSQVVVEEIAEKGGASDATVSANSSATS